ncbi:MAG: nuclear transport factor 2 family protein, partial [Saprospiraceae bacterium]
MKDFFIALAFFSATAAFGQSANLTTVMNNYAAFGKGDVPVIIASTSDDCTWTHPGDATVPFAGTFIGHDGIGQFFTAVGKSVAITTFEPTNFREDGN